MSKPHEGHEKHLCKLLADGGARAFDSLRQYSREPHWICLTCGRVAESKDNLCEPDPL